MNKTATKTIRMDDETKGRLAYIAIISGLGEGEIVRALINKAFKDPITIDLVKKFAMMEKAEKAGVDLTSYNVRNEDKNALPEQGTGLHPVSSQENDSTHEITDEELDAALGEAGLL